MRSRLSLILFFFVPVIAITAQDKADSLEKLLPGTSDTARLHLLLRIGRAYNNVNPTTASSYYSQALELALTLSDSDGVKSSQRGLGLSTFLRGDYLQAIEHEKKALSVTGSKPDPISEADTYTIIGMSDFKLGKVDQSIEMYKKALKIYREQNDVQRSSMILNNMGSLYYQQTRYKEALDLFLQSKPLKEKVGDKKGLASINMNIATIYTSFDSMEVSLKYYQYALDYYLQKNDSLGMAGCYSGMGTDYLKLKDYKTAFGLKQKALEIARAIGDKSMVSHVLNDFGDIYSLQNDFPKAEQFLMEALGMAKETKDIFQLVQTYSSLVKHYKRKNDLASALKYTQLLSASEDSLFNEKNSHVLSEIKSRYDAEQKQSAIDILKKDRELDEVRVKKNDTWRAVLFPGLALFILVVIVLLGRNELKKRTSRALQVRNDLLSQQDKEITESIEYALSIQRSMLPSHEYISGYLKEFFVLNRPKDIVSGDFYFFEAIGDRVVFSAVDCTGHGVPGALLSFLGMDILREAVRKKNMNDPAGILGFLDHQVNQRLRQSTDSESVSDGMDLALCSIDLKTRVLKYAGSFNPAWIISNGKLEEIKPDKHAIGSNPDDKADTFTSHERQLKPGDCIYIFSDGYADQFGGRAGKKFKYKPLQQLLLDIHHRPMHEQQRVLDDAYQNWKGDLFQVDDVLVIGVRIS
ncbi:MAG TPA: tetratricopeptide repeat protein [Bacteroidia bacterium]|jgi:serine phosphatase RsbU (regulator of sigma subunit)/Tfp pilus assembly protein PilF